MKRFTYRFLMGLPAFFVGVMVGIVLSVPVIKQAFDEVDFRIDRSSICGGR